MKDIIVTGGYGQVGKFLQEIMPDAIYLHSDLCELRVYSKVRQMFMAVKPAIIVHLAAKVGGIMDNIAKPADYYDENITMNTNVLRAAKECGCKNLIAMLSTCIYPNICDNYPLKETELFNGKPNDNNFSYAISKRALAAQIEAYNIQHKVNYSYLIPCNLYSEKGDFDLQTSHFVNALIHKIRQAILTRNDHIELYGDGTPLRQFMYAGDLARVIKICIENDIYKSFNVATPETLSIKDIAMIALKACDAEHLDIKFDKTRPNGQHRKDADIELMKQHIPDFEFTSLFDGIKKTYDSLL